MYTKIQVSVVRGTRSCIRYSFTRNGRACINIEFAQLVQPFPVCSDGNCRPSAAVIDVEFINGAPEYYIGGNSIRQDKTWQTKHKFGLEGQIILPFNLTTQKIPIFVSKMPKTPFFVAKFRCPVCAVTRGDKGHPNNTEGNSYCATHFPATNLKGDSTLHTLGMIGL